MILEVNGVQYDNFIAASCEIRLDSLCRQFSFSATADGDQSLPFKGGEKCKVRVDGELVITGTIEIVDVSYDSEAHNIQVSGRSLTGDLLDSTLDSIPSISGENLTLKKLMQIIIDHLGLSIKVIDNVSPAAFTAAEDLPNPEPGENAFQFVEKYARKRQVLLTDDKNGNIVIASNSAINGAGRIQHILNSVDNNVLSAAFTYDITGRYNRYKVVSGLNPSALNFAGDTDLDSIASQGGGATDSAIKAGRQLIIEAEAPFSDSQCVERAKWESNIRKSRGLVYSCVLGGFRVAGDSGELWQTNRLYQITDDFLGKVEPMLANSVRFNFDLDEGSTTEIGFVGPQAYTQFLTDSAQVASNVI